MNLSISARQLLNYIDISIKELSFLPESLIKAIKLFTIICIFIGHLKLDKIPDDNIQRKAELYYEANHFTI